MTIPLSTIKTELVRWVETASGLASNRIIFAYESAPQGSGAYVHIWPTIQILKHGAFDETGEVDSNGDVITKSYRTVIAFIQAFGTGANQTMSAIQDACDNPVYQAFFLAADLSVLCESIIDQTVLKGRNYEERARMEVRIFCGSEVTDDIGYFDSVEYSSVGFNIPSTTIEI